MNGNKISGAKLRAARLRAGMTTKDLSEKSGVSESTIEGIESGKRKGMNDATLMGFAKAFGMDPIEFEKSVREDAPASQGA